MSFGHFIYKPRKYAATKFLRKRVQFGWWSHPYHQLQNDCYWSCGRIRTSVIIRRWEMKKAFQPDKSFSIWKILSVLRQTTSRHDHTSAVYRVVNFPMSDVLLGTRFPVKNGQFISLKQNPTLSARNRWHIISPWWFQWYKRGKQVYNENCASRCQQGNEIKHNPSAKTSNLNG